MEELEELEDVNRNPVQLDTFFDKNEMECISSTLGDDLVANNWRLELGYCPVMLSGPENGNLFNRHTVYVYHLYPECMKSLYRCQKFEPELALVTLRCASLCFHSFVLEQKVALIRCVSVYATHPSWVIGNHPFY